MGNAIWERFCIEHGVSPDGIPLDTLTNETDEGDPSSIFDIGNSGNYIPRVVFIDSEATVIGKNSTIMDIVVN